MSRIIRVAQIGSGVEESGVTDPHTGLPIRVSIGVRKLYREVFGEKSVSNKELNQIIASDFAQDAGGVFHYFPSKTEQGSWIEIRKSGKGYINYYFSIARGSSGSYSSIDIIFIRTDVLQPRSKRLILPGRK